MAAVSGVRSCHATLTGSVVDTVTLSGGGRKRAEIVHHGNVSDVIYFRLDGTDPVAAADENEVILPSTRLPISLPDDGIVKVISAGAATYSVIVTG